MDGLTLITSSIDGSLSIVSSRGSMGLRFCKK
uniref:Uncharacterized protein n=1 Tax=Rhizophora mucronata TaxID=61149 RepID=A0A2P2NXH6_RHIMU